MKRLVLSLILGLAATLFTHAQDAESADVRKNDPLKDYLRPSLTVLYIDRGETVAGKIIEQMQAIGIPGKFDENAIANNGIKANGKVSDAELDQFIETQVTKEVVRCWFPSFDPSSKGFSTDVIAERGRYNATDAEVLTAGASTRKEAMLKDAGLKLIGRSYIVVYDLYDSKTTANENAVTYETKCNVYLYQLDWNPEVEALFYEQWSNPEAIDQVKFPAKKIAAFIAAGQLTPVSVSNSKSRPIEESLFLQNFAKVLEQKADVYLTQVNEDFKVKTSVASAPPVRAKIGTKEGVSVDQRYFVYEIQLNAAGDQVPKRKGVVRATSSIVKNEIIATGDGGTTKFYQTYGGNLREGMLMQQKPDWGVGISAFGGTDATVLAEFSVGMWLNEFVPSLRNIRFPSGTKIYAKYALPFTTMEVDEVKLVDSETQDELNFGLLSFGLSKDLYFAHIFSVTPYVGYSMLLTPSEYKESIEATEELTYGIDAGLNLTVAVLHNVQIIGNAGYNSVKTTWYPNGITLGAGLRVQF
ncbi:MAG: hypothetical protein LBT83_03800 [Tannerella sp.]|jgi:hypothetical protein|nr:hypothetical protein [Tannerella sp.]